MLEKAITLYVLRSPALGDCTNRGVSARYDRVLCLCPDGNIDVDMDNPPENLFHLVKRDLFGGVVFHIEPVARPKPGNNGWMAGGNFAAPKEDLVEWVFGGRFAETADSRMWKMTGGFYGALAIHDRQETQYQSDILSR